MHAHLDFTTWFTRGRLALTAGLLCVLCAPSTYAETIEFPEEELATESVLPVFDKKIVVRERKVKTEGRFEVGAGGGLNLVEPLYGQATFSFEATYHLTELHSINVSGYSLSTALSSAGRDLQEGTGIATTFDASLAPSVESMVFANYQFTAYYGKISVAKQTTMNLSLFGSVGLGMVNWTDESNLGLDFGLGQKLFFNPNLALQIDLFMAVYQGPDPTSPKDDAAMQAGKPTLKSSDFDSTVYFRPFLTGSLVYMF